MASLVKGMQYLTDALGATDSKAASRAHSAMESGQEEANQQLGTDLSGSLSALADAYLGRSLAQNLDDYDTQMAQAQDATSQAGQIALGQQNAGSAGNVESYLNPMMDQMLARTSQAMQGNAGSALQSSATNKDISSAVSNQAGQLWQSAFNNAMSDAQNNLNVATNYGQSAGQTANLADQQLTADNQPMEDYLSLNNDVAMQRYAANTGLTQADMTLAGQKQTLL